MMTVVFVLEEGGGRVVVSIIAMLTIMKPLGKAYEILWVSLFAT